MHKIEMRDFGKLLKDIVSLQQNFILCSYNLTT